MRRVLVLVSLAVTSMVALAFVLPLAIVVRDVARDRAFSEAELQAAALEPALTITTSHRALEQALLSTQAGAEGRVALHLPGTVTIGVGYASNAQVTAARATGREANVTVPGGYAVLEPVALAGTARRVAVIEVFLPGSSLSDGVTRSWALLGLVAVVLVAGSVLVADRLGARVVRATKRLGSAAATLGEGDLSVRVPPDGPPELVEAGRAFNAMADRIRGLLAAERELAADLSHRLRTPLTALRLTTGPEVAPALDQLEREVDLIIRAVRQPSSAVASGCDAAEVLRERLAFWSVLAEDEGRRWELAGTGQRAPLPVPAAELSDAIDALLGNIFQHTPQGTAFGVTLHHGAEITGILVSDGGRGIANPDAALRRGSSGAGSTGLGLDIARRVAEATGGNLRISRSATLGGAEIQLWFHAIGRGSSRAQRRIKGAIRRRLASHQVTNVSGIDKPEEAPE
jgi:signal transduction histidine kinase